MGADSREEVERILKDGFADREVMPATEENVLSDECWSIFAEHTAHLALHVNDKRHSEFMRETVSSKLLCGGFLYPAERAWLIYVLENLDDIPRECKNGRPIDGEGETFLRLALAQFWIDDEIRNPGTQRGYVTERLNRAASALRKSYETIRKMYYGDNPVRDLIPHLKKRGFNPLGKNRKIDAP